MSVLWNICYKKLRESKKPPKLFIILCCLLELEDRTLLLKTSLIFITGLGGTKLIKTWKPPPWCQALLCPKVLSKPMQRRKAISSLLKFQFQWMTMICWERHAQWYIYNNLLNKVKAYSIEGKSCLVLWTQPRTQFWRGHTPCRKIHHCFSKLI